MKAGVTAWRKQRDAGGRSEGARRAARRGEYGENVMRHPCHRPRRRDDPSWAGATARGVRLIPGANGSPRTAASAAGRDGRRGGQGEGVRRAARLLVASRLEGIERGRTGRRRARMPASGSSKRAAAARPRDALAARDEDRRRGRHLDTGGQHSSWSRVSGCSAPRAGSCGGSGGISRKERQAKLRELGVAAVYTPQEFELRG